MAESDNIQAKLASIEGKLDTLNAHVTGQINEIRSSMAAGDRQNETAIVYVRADVTRLEHDLVQHKQWTADHFDAAEENIDRNRRLMWTTLAAPLIVGVMGALLLRALGVM